MLMLKEMEYVYAVYQEKSFSRAAKRLFISQPALSAAIRKAEAEIRTPIFDRSSSPIHPTPAGEYYIESIERIMAIRGEMEEYFSALAGERRGTVQVGAAAFFCAHVLPTAIEEFQRQHPGYRVNLLEANVKDLRKCLQSGVIDLSLDVERADSSLFQSVFWQTETILLAVPSGFEINERLRDYRLTFSEVRRGKHLEAGHPAVRMEHFAQQPFLLLKKENDLYQRALKICKNAGFTPRTVMQLDQLLTSYYVACDGKGLAFLRDGLTRHIEANDRLYFYKIDDENAVRNIMLSYRKSGCLSVPAREFLEFMTSGRLAAQVL